MYKFLPIPLFFALLTGCATNHENRPATYTPVWLDTTQATQDSGNNTQWYNALDLGLEGQGWQEGLEHPYDRLPLRAKGLVTNSVWGLSHNSAGLAIRFMTDSESISARWSLRKDNLGMHHMPPMGVSGLDMYVKEDGTWQWVGFGSPKQKENNIATLVPDAPQGIHEYIITLPLYNGTDKLEIGIAPNAKIGSAPQRTEVKRNPIVFYGTSITQGGTVSRTGMAYPATLGRRFNRESINLGFSGNGRMELEMADLLAELDASVYILDCLPNMNAELIHERFAPFVKRLRKAKPDTPIVLVENIIYQGSWFSKSRARHIPKNEAIREEYQKLRSLGIKELFYVDSKDLLGHDGLGTVDGTHPNDLGMLRIADAIEPAVRAALKR